MSTFANDPFAMAPSLVPPGNKIITIDGAPRLPVVGEAKSYEAALREAAQAAVTRPASKADQRRNRGRRPVPLVKLRAAVGRNAPCPCASGRKFKRCCGARGRQR